MIVYNTPGGESEKKQSEDNKKGGHETNSWAIIDEKEETEREKDANYYICVLCGTVARRWGRGVVVVRRDDPICGLYDTTKCAAVGL